MTSYSTFFSSGLAPSHDILAAYPRPRPRMDSTSSTLSVMSTISTGETFDDTSDLEDHEYMKKDDFRETTPTPQTTALRRRKSSLSINASPMTAVRSPAKAAENALSYQRHLSRSRSGSVSSVMASSHEDSLTALTQKTVGAVGTARVNKRLRSGSIGTALKPSRRGLRQPTNNPLPPPSVPLPPVPPSSFVTSSIPQRQHSRSISLVPRRLGSSANRDLLPPLPPTPSSYEASTRTALAQ